MTIRKTFCIIMLFLILFSTLSFVSADDDDRSYSITQAFVDLTVGKDGLLHVEEEYDLSHVMFILTANYLYQIPEALRDRLEIIEINGYTEYEKLDIAKKHLITRLLKEHGLDDKNVSISDNALMMIIRNYTKEAGVRELERCISKIFRKIAKEIDALLA